MSYELVKFAVLLLYFRNVNALYWSRGLKPGNSSKRYFHSSIFPDLNGLEIPSVIWNMLKCDGPCLQSERQVLLDMRHLLGGDSWKHKWNIEKNNATVNNTFHCNWYGILCEHETKHVLAIGLEENNLLGKLPSNFTDLQFLLSFRINSNSVQGQFERVVATMSKYLLRLDFADTKIKGGIPKSIANSLPFLVNLQTSGSSLNGEIPDSIGDLIHLKVLSLGETRIIGSVPQSVSKLTKLRFLDLEALKLRGNLSFLYNLRQLQYLHLLSNEITGEIPEHIGEWCPVLEALLLSNNKLTGQLPRSIGKLKHLVMLNVGKNNLSGPIPRDLCDLHLKVLILSSNSFTGFEANRNCKFKNLKMFMASNLPAFNCSLNTALSYIISSHNTLIQIDISHSNLYGHLPKSLLCLQQLASLKLASNKLTGPLPDPANTMPYLTLIDLQDNDFSGSIPQTFSRLIMLNELNLKGNMRLRGTIVTSLLHLDYAITIKDRASDTCPTVRFVHNRGTVYVDPSYYDRKYCFCNERFFGNGMHCVPCMHGGSCPGLPINNLQSNTASTLEKNKLQIPTSWMLLRQGYFPFPSELDVKSIDECPSSHSYSKICSPNGDCECYINTTDKKVAIRKTESTEANGIRIMCNKSCLCLQGYHGRYCSQCIEGYYKEGIRCLQCPAGQKKSLDHGLLFGTTIACSLTAIGILLIATKKIKLSIVLALFEVALIMALVLRHLITAVLLQIVIIIFILGFSSHFQRCTALLKSAMFYIQIMDSLISTTDIWPQSIYRMQAYVSSSLNLCFSSLACNFPTFFTPLAKSLMLFLLPLICIGFLWLTYYLWKAIFKPDEEKVVEFNCKCRKYSLVVFDVSYFPIVKSCFSVIVGCKEIEGTSFMTSYAWIDCKSYEHISLTVIAIFEIILYLIAVPFLIYLPLLFRHRNHLQDDSSGKYKWLSPLTAPYKPKYRAYIEVVMLMRRLVIAILMAALPTNSSLQIQCITILLLTAIVFQAATRPLRDPTKVKSNDEVYNDRLGLENGIDAFMLCCVLLSFVCARLLAGDGKSASPVLYIILLFVNALFVIAFCLSMLYRLLWVGSSEEDCGMSRDLLTNVNEEDCYLSVST